MKIKIELLEGGKQPQRAHHNDAGADVFSRIDHILKPNETKAIPLGVKVFLPDGVMGVVHDKSGLSSKGISNANAPIDSGYTGEIHAILTNTTLEPFEIKIGQKVGQLVIIPILIPTFIEDELEQRGSHGFGSTGEF